MPAPLLPVADEIFVEKACPGRLVSFTKRPAVRSMVRAAVRRSRRGGGSLTSHVVTRVASGTDLRRLIKTYAKGAVRESPSFSDLMVAPAE